MSNLGALLLTIFMGLFFGLGFIVVHLTDHKKELTIFSTGMAFIVMLGIVFFDLLPEITEQSALLTYPKWGKIAFILLFMILGLALLKLFDVLLPHHHHECHEKENTHEHNEHEFHIGFMTSFSLIFHNILEGISVYVISCSNITSGLLAAIGVGCHNFPLGIEIESNLSDETQNHKLKIIMQILLMVSGALGSLLLYIFGNGVPNLVILILLCISCGMILYIGLFELLGEVRNYKKNKDVYYGMVTGVIVILIMTLLG